ncbi:MAG: hypothetical protein GQ527_06810, partial [Bacteroidales bacterium]|nr:hypothetical protein [Bacteroidales bacterium]
MKRQLLFLVLLFSLFLSSNINATPKLMDGLRDSIPTPTKNLLVIKAEGVDGFDRTNISFNPNTTAGFDKEYDRLKFIVTNKARPQIYTFGGEMILGINQLPDTALMDLAVQAGQDGSFTMSIDKNIGFDFVVLEDLIWKKKIDLLEQDYTFDYFTSDGDYPFKLYFKPWALEPVNETDLEVYYYPESIVVRSRKQVASAYITFFDLSGKRVLEFLVQDFHYFEKPISLPVGHYIVQ